MLTINWNQNYSKCYAENGDKWLRQNGLKYDLKGKALDKKKVRAKISEAADASQAAADEAMAVAKGFQDQADADQALLDSPEAPQTVAALKVALDEMDVEYSSSDKKPDLEQKWVDAQAG